MFNFKQLNAVFLCFSMGACFGTLLSGQQVNQTTIPTYQQPTQSVQQGQVYPSQTAPNYQQPYPNGQVIDGQYFGGQIINGQPVYQQPIQGGIIVNPGVPNTTILPGQQPAVQQPAQQARPLSKAEGEKMAAQAKLIKEQTGKIEFLVNENVRLSEMAESGEKLEQEVQRLTQDYEAVNSELVALRNKPAGNSTDMTAQQQELTAQQQELNQLNTRYQQVVRQNEGLSDELNTLTNQMRTVNDEKATIANELSGLRAAGGNMSTLQNNLATATTTLGELRQKNQGLVSENERLNGLYETVSTEKENLGERVALLTSENEGYVATINSTPAADDDSFVSAGAGVRTEYVAKENPVNADLVEQNRRLLSLKEKAELQNAKLTQQLSELEGTVGELTSANSSLNANANSKLEVNLIGSDASDSKFAISKWILPFLAIGLAVGLYVFLTEEMRGGRGTRTIASGAERSERVSDHRDRSGKHNKRDKN